MTANEIRQSFFDFFKEKQHTIVPSASLLPQSPGLLFTNAGMNQFVPYFLGTEKAPYSPPRAADTQKCIRAGGKHNDLDDVGYDTYHHTMFEMLGNWSFGDYFKAEAIQWSWELIVERWGFPPERLYATVYMPGEGDPSAFDQEAYDLWAKLFEAKGLDPKKHIVNGDVKDNFWMMGDTGPCGPCSELHVDLTPNGDTNGELVNKDSDLCIEIWNLVFIQYNAEADGSFRDLPAKHIDTGMGFERACSIYQGTQGFTDFSKKPTNYATDVFTTLFKKIEELSGKTYQDIYPESVETDKSTLSAEMKEAVAFRVIADHIRTLSFSIADGILPGKNGRNSVLRGILRRCIRYGRRLGFSAEKTFLADLVDTLADQMSHVFPELQQQSEKIKTILRSEEDSCNQTLDNGENLFVEYAVERRKHIGTANESIKKLIALDPWNMDTLPNEVINEIKDIAGHLNNAVFNLQLSYEKFTSPTEQALFRPINKFATTVQEYLDVSTTLCNYSKDINQSTLVGWQNSISRLVNTVTGECGFELHQTYGFPIGLTRLLCEEHGLVLDIDRYYELMDEERERGRQNQKKTIVRALDITSEVETEFTGYDEDSSQAEIREVHEDEDKLLVITDRTPFYVEMGGQLGDTGVLTIIDSDEAIPVTAVQKIGSAVAHVIDKAQVKEDQIVIGKAIALTVDSSRRRPIEAHHSATHLLHWALHEVVSTDATQQGSLVGTDRLRFDFTSGALSNEQISQIENLVNSKIKEGAPVHYVEVPHVDVKDRSDIMQFFGDKYGELVRVVQIGGHDLGLDGYAMELCGGTHVSDVAEIGIFKIKSEGAIASGVRRIEAVCGDSAWNYIREEVEKHDHEEKELRHKLNEVNAKLQEAGAEPVHHGEFPHIMGALLVEGDFEDINSTFQHYIKHVESLKNATVEADKSLKKAQAAAAASMADEALVSLLEQGGNIVSTFEGPANLLQELLNGLKKKQFTQAAFLIVDDGERLHLGAFAGADGQAAGHKAGNLIKDLAPLAGGKGGGKPDQARGAAPQRDKAQELLAAANAALA
ncbi:alanyl-tRNA synthetase [Rubritalea squalenifaciens DSM 18772]|uniref:Alanine--tRNA ligase n=1 Tax=Rubritalea squalenifaciens DSM 18772 TaxID=1123071 RepID=A0A1M6SQY9_9BACT|nr:alanine--tRNA ligase [Rubritalea squalenifaciens]SHK47164.1 alanyl-tRNA synthetase [Rubritalea squalenifaciens DSM 18772]